MTWTARKEKRLDQLKARTATAEARLERATWEYLAVPADQRTPAMGETLETATREYHAEEARIKREFDALTRGESIFAAVRARVFGGSSDATS